jgi:hypothetical protein
MSSSLYPQTQTLKQERLLHSIEGCGTNYYKINTSSHSLDSHELTSTISTDQATSQTTTTGGHNTVNNHQNPSKKRGLQAYKSATHQYLQSIYQTLPHHTALEQQNPQEQTYQSSHLLRSVTIPIKNLIQYLSFNPLTPIEPPSCLSEPSRTLTSSFIPPNTHSSVKGNPSSLVLSSTRSSVKTPTTLYVIPMT